MSRRSGAQRRQHARQARHRATQTSAYEDSMKDIFRNFCDRADLTQQQISWHLLTQRQGQDVTITYTDGTTYTARYIGSHTRRIEGPGGPWTHFKLEFITDINATIDKGPT